MTITLSSEAKKQSIASIRRYFAEHMDEEIGDLKANLLLDFVVKEIAPTVYNKAIGDAAKYFQDKVTDLEGAQFEVEFSYWVGHDTS